MSMPSHVAKALQRFDIQAPNRPQHSPYEWVEQTYGQHVQLIPPADITKPLDSAGTTRLQEIIGILLYYRRAINNTILVALGSLAAAQTKGTLATSKAAIHLLNYAASHPNATVRFRAFTSTVTHPTCPNPKHNLARVAFSSSVRFPQLLPMLHLQNLMAPFTL
jgi:hypothetical protein